MIVKIDLIFFLIVTVLLVSFFLKLCTWGAMTDNLLLDLQSLWVQRTDPVWLSQGSFWEPDCCATSYFKLLSWFWKPWVQRRKRAVWLIEPFEWVLQNEECQDSSLCSLACLVMYRVTLMHHLLCLYFSAPASFPETWPKKFSAWIFRNPPGRVVPTENTILEMI